MGNLFARSAAGANLTPAERALLKLIEGCVAAGLVAALPVVADALAKQPVPWGTMLPVALSAFATGVLMALIKWAKAHLDDPLVEPETTVSLTPAGHAAVADAKPAA